MTTATARLREICQSPPQSVLFAVAVFSVIVANIIPVARGMLAIIPVWMSVLQFGVGLCLLGLTSLVAGFRSLRTLGVAVIVIQTQWLLFQFNISDELLESVALSDTGAVLLAEGVELAPAVIALVALSAIGYTRSDVLLRVSTRSQTTDFTWVPGIQTEWSWRRASVILGTFFVSAFLAIRLYGGVNYAFGAYTAKELSVIVPAVLLVAAVNSFQERVLYAAIPLSELTDAIGKSQAVFLLGAMFGFSHYAGTPGGPVGVLMTGFLGCVLAKIMIETRSIAAAWVVHWLLDITIFSAVLT